MDFFQLNQIMNTTITPTYRNDHQTNRAIFDDLGDFNFKLLLQSKINEAIQLNGKNITQNSYNSFPFTSTPQMNHHLIETMMNNTINDTVNKVTNERGSQSSFNSIIKQAAEKFNVDEKLIHAVIKMESNYRPDATSHAGAQGLMQLMPQTARGLGVKNSYDPIQNIFGGTKYLRQMLNQFNGNVRLALAAYNAGPGNVRKYGGVPPFKETQNYVKNVLNNYKI